MTRRECSVSECTRAHVARNFCKLHYRRFMKYGDPLHSIPSDVKEAIEGHRVCNQCGETKLLENFRKDSRYLEGRTRICKVCLSPEGRRAAKVLKDARDRQIEGTFDNVRPYSNLRQKVKYPEDSELLKMFESVRTLSGVADLVGVSPSSLREYLKKNSELNEACRSFLRSKLSPEDADRNNRAAKRRWRYSNPERVKEYKRRWASSRTDESVRSSNIRSQEKRRALLSAFEMTPEEISMSYEYEDILRRDLCSYCGTLASMSVDHIQPIETGGSDKWENKTAACRSCNSSKRDKELLHFMLWRIEKENHASRYRRSRPNYAD